MARVLPRTKPSFPVRKKEKKKHQQIRAITINLVVMKNKRHHTRDVKTRFKLIYAKIIRFTF